MIRIVDIQIKKKMYMSIKISETLKEKAMFIN